MGVDLVTRVDLNPSMVEVDEPPPPGQRARGVDEEEGGGGSRDLTGYVTELLPDHTKFDASGVVWGRAGHFPLFVMLGTHRQRSEEGDKRGKVGHGKRNHWKNSGKTSWPWWIWHESERTYWLPGGPHTGRGHSGHPFQKNALPSRLRGLC